MAIVGSVKKFVGVRNNGRSRLRVGGKTVKNTANTYVDLNDGKVRRDLARFVSEGNALLNASGSQTVKFSITGATATTVGGLGVVDLGEKAVVKSVAIVVNTISTGAANLGIGHNTAGAGGTANTSIVAAQAVGTGNAGDQLPAIATAQGVVVPAVNHIILTGSADTTGLVADVYITYNPLP